MASRWVATIRPGDRGLSITREVKETIVPTDGDRRPMVRTSTRTYHTYDAIGPIQPDKDVGKRVYLVDAEDPTAPPIIQVESDEQRDTRLAMEGGER